MRPLKTERRRRNRKPRRKNSRSRKKILSIFQNKALVIEFWHLLFFSGTTFLLICTFLNQAWKPIDFEQTKITGISGLRKIDIQKKTLNFYPKNLLELNPKEIEASLIKKLPIKEISISRRFFPPGISFNITEREPIAFASRNFSNNIENGMIDIEGSWIPLKYTNNSKKRKIKLFIENWSPNKKNEIIKILKNRSIFTSSLQKIKINPLQEIIIKTEHFNSVLLGSNTDRLLEQIQKLNQLQESLPNLLINTKVKIVDLKDPRKPELKIEKILKDEK